ncbi:hypothetical protein PABG_11046 [Paracoccidioides brasiliensis Pb03]|uniref:Uncharacterized protein n=1 Tax=Paracoccidioides brasiliensis TaxID=121759 RepID=A0A1D2J7E2_PARBR|nr:hypothetical protein PABG_11046 [Paracoccidioides brasiliensis Pb03]ODH15275.1 hypothetical protein ACO22_06456 [Paracoccidioides brasiliensis]ODH52581.1 hypothetical protein GX48_01361 [Paracoccidioides brasiliensis]
MAMLSRWSDIMLVPAIAVRDALEFSMKMLSWLYDSGLHGSFSDPLAFLEKFQTSHRGSHWGLTPHTKLSFQENANMFFRFVKMGYGMNVSEHSDNMTGRINLDKLGTP